MGSRGSLSLNARNTEGAFGRTLYLRKSSGDVETYKGGEPKRICEFLATSFYNGRQFV